MSSFDNFIVFPFSAVAGLFSFFTKRSERKQPEREKGRNGVEGEWQGASGGAVRDKLLLVYCLARHRRMSPSDCPSPGRRAYTRKRQSGGGNRETTESGGLRLKRWSAVSVQVRSWVFEGQPNDETADNSTRLILL